MALLSFRGLIPRLDDGIAELDDDAVIVDSAEIAACHPARPWFPLLAPTSAEEIEASSGEAGRAEDAIVLGVATATIVLRGGESVIVHEPLDVVAARWRTACQGGEWPTRSDGIPAFPERHAARFGGGAPLAPLARSIRSAQEGPDPFDIRRDK